MGFVEGSMFDACRDKTGQGNKRANAAGNKRKGITEIKPWPKVARRYSADAAINKGGNCKAKDGGENAYRNGACKLSHVLIPAHNVLVLRCARQYGLRSGRGMGEISLD